jgi:exopolysaccharide production protein ExoY
MALVGPRPIVEEEVPLFGVHFHHYCAVRPGITGLWQVSGRNNLSFRRRVVLDVAYVRAKCLKLDLSILMKTVPAVLWQRGSY